MINNYDQEFKKKVYSHISKYAMADDWRASWEIIKTILILILTLYMEKSNSMIIYVLGCLLRGLIYLRIFSMFHDFAHNSFYSRQAYNDICAYGQTMLFGMPYTVWTKKHNFHHKFSNNLNYVQDNQTAPLTLIDYLNLPPHLQFIYEVLYSQFGLWFITPVSYMIISLMDALHDDKISFAFLLMGAIFKSYITNSSYDFVSQLIAATIGMQMFHVQHTYEDAQRSKEMDYFENGLKGASYIKVPWFFRFFTFGIEYHHIHHLNARIPGYYLQECHDQALLIDKDIWNDVHVIQPSQMLSFYNGLMVYDELKNTYLDLKQIKTIKHQYNLLQKQKVQQ